MELNEFERAQIAFEKMQSKEINENIYLRFKELVNANRDKIEKIKEIDEKYVDVIPAIDTILKHIENNKKIGHYTDIIEQRKTKIQITKKITLLQAENYHIQDLKQ